MTQRSNWFVSQASRVWASRRLALGRPVWLALVCAFFSLSALAQSPAAAFDNANRLYEQGKFGDAAAAFEKLVQSGHVSEAIYYNWGNALFKAGNLGRA